MPTVDRIEKLRVVIYPNDHRPAHVHVIGKGCEAVFKLYCAEGRVDILENYRFPAGELTKIKTIIAKRLARLCAAWSEIHGEY